MAAMRAAAAAPAESAPLGYSVGRWDEAALVVTTNRIDWPYFDDVGTPQSAAIRTVERFSLSADGTRLDYTITVNPATFTETVSLHGYWVWVPVRRSSPTTVRSEPT